MHAGYRPGPLSPGRTLRRMPINPHASGRETPGWPVYVGIFFVFAPIGLLLGLMPADPWGWGMGLLSSGFGGLLSVGWSWSFQTRRYWTIPILLVAPATSGWWLFRPLAQAGLGAVGYSADPLTRRILLMCLAVVSLAVGFTILIRVMALNERRSARLRTELDLAARIHRTLVPTIDRRTPFVHVLGRSDASSEMGGDLIDLVVRDGAADVYLADVSGHGVRAGVLMAMLKSALRAVLLDTPGEAPPPLSAVASTLNRVLAQVAEPDMFATFAALRLDRDRRITHVLAGHWPILHYRAATRELVELGGESMPLGIDAAEAFPVGSTNAAPGDLLVMLTDGLLEVMGPDGRSLGFDELRRRILDVADRPIDEVLGSLLRQVRSFGPQADDQTIVLARVL